MKVAGPTEALYIQLIGISSCHLPIQSSIGTRLISIRSFGRQHSQRFTTCILILLR
jgi:hypothetical protein